MFGGGLYARLYQPGRASMEGVTFSNNVASVAVPLAAYVVNTGYGGAVALEVLSCCRHAV